MKDGHGGVVIGSEISGNVRNVYAENCDMNSPHLDRMLRIKSNSYRGGIVENVFMRNITVGVVADAVILVDMFYMNETGDRHPKVRNVQVKNISSKKSNYALKIGGEEEYPVEDILIEDCSFNDVAKGNSIKGARNLSLIKVKINGKGAIAIVENTTIALDKFTDEVYPSPFWDFFIVPAFQQECG